MTNYNLTLMLRYTDGRISGLPFSAGPGRHKLTDGRLEAEINAFEQDGVCQYEMTLAAVCECELKYLDILVHSGALAPEAKAYNAGFTTNCAACISRYSDIYGLISAGPLIIQGSSLLGAALVSADRFYSYFKLMPNELIIRHSMEDKRIYKDKEYKLERFILSEPASAEEFLKSYNEIVSSYYGITPEFLQNGFEPAPTGYCSWSCYYTLVNEEKLFRAEREVKKEYGQYAPNLLQIDDGWQVKHNFSGYWTVDREKFPGGLKPLSEKCAQDGMRFGLWLAPLLAADCTGFFKEHPEWKKLTRSGQNSYLCGEEKVYALNLDDQEVLEYISGVFRRAREEYGASYFKLDFMVFAIHSLFDREDVVIYDSDYSIAVYRRALRTIREAVGPESFLLACGAPLLAGAGIFNGIRITPDITWGKNKAHPSQWELIRMCSVSCAMRWFYHNQIFINDPDGLVVRDFDYDDNFDVTYNEARFWATAVALSGGSSLINEQVEKLGPARRALYAEILPPLGKAAQPADFFEYPWPTKVYIPLEDGSRLWGIYNYSDKLADMRLEFGGERLVYECWEHKALGCLRSREITDMMPHSAEVLYACALPPEARAVFSDCNIFAGAGLFESRLEGGFLEIRVDERLEACPRHGIYVFLPRGAALEEGVQECCGHWGSLVRLEARGGIMRLKLISQRV